MKVGDLVKIIAVNEVGWSESNVGELAVVTYMINNKEVEVRIFHKNGESEPWIYFNEHLEVLNEELSKRITQ
jgi:hypothetical protein